ncbi:hypothetical protein H0I71_21795 [Yersinia enterocolitica]|uniref:hypothetical protein n=1 Tax=Yersinia enterocolitica TaxID=630 RepID=UPI001C60E11F|nr:hypothetical protein [Yersinia enterocolitica]MBW5823102.1 hypothetical protein [Yersinia enterocolitica]MBW5852572.1 hypothetical protein [Yersinia enterocolitica]MBW5879095.1 hypothetical protein [Yersinia enterocolitica]HEI6739964.1 hypothetical protein [Yersinia enterocolitica]
MMTPPNSPFLPVNKRPVRGREHLSLCGLHLLSQPFLATPFETRYRCLIGITGIQRIA